MSYALKHTATPTFALRAMIHGGVDWICPYSGHLNISRVNPRTYKLVCSGSSCTRRFIPGLVFYPTIPGKQSLPPDWVIPIRRSDYHHGRGLVESMPMGDLSIVPWRRHSPTHALIDPARTDHDVGLFVRNVRQIAQAAHQDEIALPREFGDSKVLARLGAVFLALAVEQGFM